MDGRRSFSAGHGAAGAYGKTIINPIMLRFRPIAPKPLAGGSVSGAAPPENKNAYLSKARTKRKYVRSHKNKCKTKKTETGKHEFDPTVSTQQLVHQIDSVAVGSSNRYFPEIQLFHAPQPRICLNFDSMPEKSAAIAFRPSDRSDLTAMESRVTVECVMNACMEGGELGSTDVERIKNLEVDTCPAFISDGGYEVRWVNLAYKRMVCAEDGGAPPETAVELVVQAELPAAYPAFPCRVRVEYTWRKAKHTRTMPCDVWRMDFGGFAWKLDVKAALSLGR
ncbi:ATP-binding cassette sub-family A member like [Actinidia chinensis var. chinensis]|uniref:ATP-binding cassette sub-family A member like n=1 Tax=Actinidia chinensis var. chinensis TaxID=1590841 RepID=A0A2R6P905_ACTCC|nr:ATP-binding cassette sub-family A member like [Actinidia chinensis var. chinensis]